MFAFLWQRLGRLPRSKPGLVHGSIRPKRDHLQMGLPFLADGSVVGQFSLKPWLRWTLFLEAPTEKSFGEFHLLLGARSQKAESLSTALAIRQFPSWEAVIPGAALGARKKLRMNEPLIGPGP